MDRIIRICSLALTVLIAAAPPAAASTGGLASYLAARAADADGAAARARAGYADALAAEPANGRVAAHAYRHALVVGDLDLADRAAAVLARQNAGPPDAALLAVAHAAQAGDAAAADPAIAQLSRGQLAILAAPLAAWSAFARGADPFAPLRRAPQDVVSRRLAAETRALLLIATGRADEGVAALRAMTGAAGAGADVRVAAADLLAGRGDIARARSILANPASDMTEPVATRASLAFGAARLFVRLAADLADGQPGVLSIALGRAALRAEPGNDRARLLLANALARSGETDAALAALDGVAADGREAGNAAATQIAVLAGDDRLDEAIAAAAVRARPRDAASVDILGHGDLLLRAGRAKEAARAYARVVARTEGRARWEPWLQYGAALDQAGDWRRARAALVRAYALAPDEPVVLNYLGYGDVVHGGDADAALALIEKAAALRPGDAAIVDSLGWAHYRRGDLARALPLLERAAQASPDSAEIAEHLGDAYWQAGRRFEARYAWRAARADAPVADHVRLSGKIADGPPAR